MPKRSLWLLAMFLFAACDSNDPDPTGPGSGKALKKVSQYDRIYGSPDLPDPVNDVVWTYYFTKAGKFDFAFSAPADTDRNDSAYLLATGSDTIFDAGLGPYPAYKEFKANEIFDPYGHLIAYTEVFKYETGSDSSYNFWFLNEYWDGQVTGGIPK